MKKTSFKALSIQNIGEYYYLSTKFPYCFKSFVKKGKYLLLNVTNADETLLYVFENDTTKENKMITEKEAKKVKINICKQ